MNAVSNCVRIRPLMGDGRPLRELIRRARAWSMTITKLSTLRFKPGYIRPSSPRPVPRLPVFPHPRTRAAHLHQASSPSVHPSLRNSCRPASTTSMDPSSGNISAGSAESVATTPSSIIRSLDERFEAAKAAKDVLFFPSTVHRHTEGGVDVSAVRTSDAPYKSDSVLHV